MKANEGSFSEGVSGYCAFGAKTVSCFAEMLQKHMQGAILGGDPEDVHQMRVFSRRTRAALPLFSDCFPAAKMRMWEKEIKRAARSLGNARDADVQISFLESYLKNGGRKGNLAASTLLLRLTEKRKVMHEEVRASLEELEGSGLLTDIGEECGKAIKTDMQNNNLENISYSCLTCLAAHIYINAKIDDLLAIEHCVYREEDTIGHHRMRIAAKRLRYTMEIYRDLYENRLQEEISELKGMQDTLGEMHDCDVWIERLPALLAEAKQRTMLQDIEYGNASEHAGMMGYARRLMRGIHRERILMKTESDSLDFLQELRSRRKNLYRAFVSVWNDTKGRKFFEHLSEKTGKQVTSKEKGGLKIALIADVHANKHALTAVLEDAKKNGAEALVNAGDLVGYGAFPEESVSALRSENAYSIAGNYDQKVVKRIEAGCKKGRCNTGKAKDLEYTCGSLTKESKRFLSSLPSIMGLNLGGKRILVVHGSPDSADEYIKPDTPENRLEEIAKASGADVIVSGHAHIQFTRTVGGVTFIAPGSVGRPYDNDSRAAYAILTLEPFKIELLRVPYDLEAATFGIRKKKLPESLAQSLLLGSSLEETENQKAEKREDTGACLKKVEEAAFKYRSDISHEKQVCELSMKIFDDLSKVSGLGKEERFYLECASLLHDIGWSRGGKGHHKASLRLILNDQSLPFDPRERYIIGSIARYHKGRLPKQKDYNLSPLSAEEKKKTLMLSSIMRLADGMDASHQSIVKEIKITPADNALKILCLYQGDKSMEEEGIAEKKDLITKTLHRDVLISWRQKA